MSNNFKNIHIGSTILKRTEEINIDIVRICNFFKCTEESVAAMYKSENIDALSLLKWSKLLEYDFFRLYSQHLILYAPQCGPVKVVPQKRNSILPQFRKNIYTQEVIYFMLELVESGKKTKQEIISEYGIPKTTLYKWIEKYGK